MRDVTFFLHSAKKVSEKPSSTGNEKEVNRHKGKKASDTAVDETELKPAKSQTAPKKQDQAVENQNSKKRYLLVCRLNYLACHIQFKWTSGTHQLVW